MKNIKITDPILLVAQNEIRDILKENKGLDKIIGTILNQSLIREEREEGQYDSIFDYTKFLEYLAISKVTVLHLFGERALYQQALQRLYDIISHLRDDQGTREILYIILYSGIEAPDKFYLS